MRTIGFNAPFCCRLALGALVILVGLAFAAPAEARDRPGTPNKESLWICDYPQPTFAPALCGTFNNTATEVVRIEIETTRNGQPYSLDANTFNCRNLDTRRVFTTDPGGNVVPTSYYAPFGEICYAPAKTYGRKRDDPDWVYTFETPTVDWNTQYCIHFRARRVSDSVVSEKWSNYACANVPRPPAAPSRSDFSVSFSGSQMYNQSTGTSAKLGQTAQVMPAKVTVTQITGGAGAIVYRLTVGGQLQEWKPGVTTLPHTFSLAENQAAVVVQLCGYNFAGRTCTPHTINVLGQGVQLQTPRPGLNAATAPTPAPAYVPARPMGVTNQSNRETFMVGVDMPGNDYSNKPIAGTAVDCQSMCNADGKCISWTWVKPGVQNAQAMCWLKNAVPASRSNPNTTSGIKAGSTAVH